MKRLPSLGAGYQVRHSSVNVERTALEMIVSSAGGMITVLCSSIIWGPQTVPSFGPISDFLSKCLLCEMLFRYDRFYSEVQIMFQNKGLHPEAE
jgi:hypothetical protein